MRDASDKRRLYAITCIAPAIYWCGLAIFIGKLLGSETLTQHMLAYGNEIAGRNTRINETKPECYFVLPLTNSEHENLRSFSDEELPGLIKIETLKEYYEKLGTSIEEMVERTKKNDWFCLTV